MSSNPGATPSRSEPARDSVVRLIASILRGDRVDARDLASVDVDELVSRAEAHGVLPLVAERLVRRSDVPSGLGAGLSAAARRHAAFDVAREMELRRLLAAFEALGVRAVLLKGAHLAYSHYERPDLRPRADTDLFIADGDRRRVCDVLGDLGYQGTGHVTGTLLMYQAAYVKLRDGAPWHVVDVHWKIANPQIFADLLSYDELVAAAAPLPALGRGALGPSDVHALVVACVHRVAHHHDADTLIWLYDIHLVASRLTAASWETFVDLVETRGVARICRHSLGRAAAEFGTRLPASVTAEPRLRQPIKELVTATYLTRGRPHLGDVVGDLRALPRWRDRLQLVAQHAFPSAEYMRGHYAPSSHAPLAILYARRAILGARKWLARS